MVTSTKGLPEMKLTASALEAAEVVAAEADDEEATLAGVPEMKSP